MSTARMSIIPDQSTTDDSEKSHLHLHADRTGRSGELTGVEKSLVQKLFVRTVSSMDAMKKYMSGQCRGHETCNSLIPVFDEWFQAADTFQNEGKLEYGSHATNALSWEDWTRIQSLAQKALAWGCRNCADLNGQRMRVALHLHHSLSPNDFLPRILQELQEYAKGIDRGIDNIQKTRDWMRLSGLSLEFPLESDPPLLRLKTVGIRRGHMKNKAKKKLKGTDVKHDAQERVIRIHNKDFVFAGVGEESELESQVDITLSATSDCGTLSNGRKRLHSQRDLESMERTLLLHSWESELAAQHFTSYYGQLARWYPTPRSVASRAKENLLSVLSNENGTRYESYWEYYEQSWEPKPEVGSEGDWP